MSEMWMLSLLSALCLAIIPAVAAGPDAELLLDTLTTLMHRSQLQRSGDSSSSRAATKAGRDPALAMTLSQSTLDDINDFLANSLGAPIELLGLHIPQLDPLTVNHFTINSEDDTLGKIDIRVKGVNITGLSTIEVRSVKLNILEPPVNFQISLDVKDVELQTNDYYINCSIANTFSFYGSGAMWFEAYGIKLYADLDLNGFSPLSVHINDLDLSINKFQSYFGNLMGGGQTGTLINEVLDDIVPNLAQALADAIKSMVNGGGTSGNTSPAASTANAA